MRKVKIFRIEESDTCVRGALTVDGVACCVTIERPWLDNEPDISCIPTGKYVCKFEYSDKYGRKLWELKDVPNRSEVKIHNGSYAHNSLGCILVGSEYGEDDNGREAVWGSKDALKKFHKMLEHESLCELEICSG